LAPASAVWTGTGTSLNWNNSANWLVNGSPGIPQAGDDLNFDSTASALKRSTVNDLPGTPSFKSITFAANGYTLGGATKIALTGGITVGQNLALETISFDLQLTPPSPGLQQTITVNSGSDLVLSGHLSGQPGTSNGV